MGIMSGRRHRKPAGDAKPAPKKDEKKGSKEPKKKSDKKGE